ncbi:MAG: TolC family protein [Gemmatimonadetes bacterium]|nr:TolC family protein [Gemmatimonadota bacterium]
MLLALSACTPPRRVGGHTATAPIPREAWPTVRRAGAPFDSSAARLARRGAQLPAAPAARLDALTLVDVIDVALGNNPQTRISWAQSRAAASAYASARGRWLPSLQADAAGGPSRAISSNPARVPADRSTVTTTISLQYLLFDFGARGGVMSAAREALYAADLTHNNTVQAVVLQSEGAYFGYQAARGLFEASKQTVATATANLAAAERRHDVGLATIADVLQARTALAQSRLASQTAEGNQQAARAQLALALGMPANAPFDVLPDTGAIPVSVLAENVDSLIERAVRERPDVMAARATARQSAQQVRVARSAMLPSITTGATRGQAFSNANALDGTTFALTFGMSVPLFYGLSRASDVAAARENAAVAAARAEQAQLNAAAQVWTSYWALQTATQRVATARDLLASATRSEEVARGRYGEGVGSILDLLTAQSALADARAQAIQSRWTWYAALAQLSRDAGVLGPHGESHLNLTPGTPGKP